MRLKTVLATGVAAAALVVAPGAAAAETLAGCEPASQVRTEGIFFEGRKAAQVKLLRARCPVGVKYFAKVVVMDEWKSLGFSWNIAARLRVGTSWVSDGGYASAPDDDVMSSGVLTSCDSGVEGWGTIEVRRDGRYIGIAANDTLPCNA